MQKRGAVTDWVEFKKAFDAYVRYKHPGKLPCIRVLPRYSGANRVKRLRMTWRARSERGVTSEYTEYTELNVYGSRVLGSWMEVGLKLDGS